MFKTPKVREFVSTYYDCYSPYDYNMTDVSYLLCFAYNVSSEMKSYYEWTRQRDHSMIILLLYATSSRKVWRVVGHPGDSSAASSADAPECIYRPVPGHAGCDKNTTPPDLGAGGCTPLSSHLAAASYLTTADAAAVTCP